MVERDKSLLLADTSFDVAMSLSSANFSALLAGVSFNSGWDTNSNFVATSLSDAGLGGSGKTDSTNFSGLLESAAVVTAASSFALFIAILNSVSAEGGSGAGAGSSASSRSSSGA